VILSCEPALLPAVPRQRVGMRVVTLPRSNPHLRRTQSHNEDRTRPEHNVLRSAAHDRFLFEQNPVPMWVFDSQSLHFLAVNRAAIERYGYSEDEFLSMTIAEIRPDASVPALLETLARNRTGLHRYGEWRHRTKAGTIIDVDIVCHSIEFEGRNAKLVAVCDVTERNRADAAAREAEENYRAIFDNAAVGMFQAGINGRPIKINRALAKMHGFESPQQMLAEIINVGTQLFVNQDVIAGFYRALKQGDVRGAEAEVYRRDGSQTWVRINLRASRDREGRPMLIEGTVEDIGEQKRAAAISGLKTALLEAQSETTLDGILAVDREDRILLANKQFGLQFGIPEQLLSSGFDLPIRTFVMDQIENPVAFIERVNHLYIHPGEKSRDEIRLKNGRSFDRYSAPLIDREGWNWGRIWYFREVTERKVAEEQIQFLAYYDALTRLPNLRLLRDRLDNALAAARRRREKVALLHIDLDRFKVINDTLGHAGGDRVLKDVAERLRASVREPDTVAKIEGDGFLVIVNGVADLPEAGAAARRIKDAIGTTCEVDGQQVSITASIGVAVNPDHGTSEDALIKNAEAAMYGAKEDGRNAIRFFSSEINGRALEQMALESEMRWALKRNEFFLVYQPQLEVATGKIVGLEALLRWKHPDLGLVPPDKFIPIAERNGRILPIGEWVLRTACEQTRQWQARGLPVVPVAVNVSAIQFRSEGFCAQVRNVLEETGLSPELLELELTESMLFQNAEAVRESVRDLQAAGVKIAIDDFGTGYSSLSYLKQFRVNKLKIDRSFIRDLPGDRDDEVITQAIIGMAKSLNLTVIAEGVETDEQMAFLKDHACDQIQGYWYSKPTSPEEIANKLQAHLAAAD
jgi:diguanylate cyclase (GGDEF)-like protein/PAS domain S-box-containing protein